MQPLLYAAGFLIFLLIAHQIVRRYQIIAWIVFLLGPFLLLPLALHQPSSDFVWLKVYSVCLGTCWLLACRYSLLGQKNWALWILWAFFAVNILEAVTEGFLVGNIINYICCIPGILLFLTLPPPKEINVDTQPIRDLLWNTPMMWIIGYSLWNWTFVYVTWPEFGIRHVAVLLASLLIGFIDNKLWIQSRALILGIYLLIHFSYDAVLKPMDLTNVYNFPLAMSAAIFVTIWMIIYFVRFISHKKN